jgi:hypothetical protein
MEVKRCCLGMSFGTEAGGRTWRPRRVGKAEPRGCLYIDRHCSLAVERSEALERLQLVDQSSLSSRVGVLAL